MTCCRALPRPICRQSPSLRELNQSPLQQLVEQRKQRLPAAERSRKKHRRQRPRSELALWQRSLCEKSGLAFVRCETEEEMPLKQVLWLSVEYRPGRSGKRLHTEHVVFQPRSRLAQSSHVECVERRHQIS